MKATLKAALDKMEERTKYTQEHQKRTHDIFEKWAKIGSQDGEIWEEISDEIRDVIDWLFDHRDWFPNHQAHHESWSALFRIANRRGNKQ